MMKTRGSRKQRQKFLLFVFLFTRLYQLKIQFRILASQQQIASSRAEANLLVAFCDRRRRRGGVGGGDEKDDEKDDENARRRAKAARDFPSSHRFDMLSRRERRRARGRETRHRALLSHHSERKTEKENAFKVCASVLRATSSSSVVVFRESARFYARLFVRCV